MKKRYFAALLILLVAALTVFSLKRVDKQLHEQLAPISAIPKSHESSDLGGRSEETNASSNLKLIAQLFKVSPDEIINHSRAACYRRLEGQVTPSNDFLAAAKPQLSKVVGEWFYRKDPKLVDVTENSPKQEKFFLALARAGFLDDAELQMDHDQTEALQLFLQVAKEDPGNSAPLIYAALIRKQNGDEVGAMKLLNLASQRPYFESYVTDYVRALQSSVETSADLVTATSTWASSPMPNYSALKDLLLQHPTLPKQMVGKAMEVNGDNPFEMNYVLIEYAVGRSALEKLKQASDLPPTKTFISKSVNYSDSFLEALNKNCDLKDLDPTVESLKRALEEKRQ